MFEFNVVDLQTIGWINQMKEFKRMIEHNLFESIEKLKLTSFEQYIESKDNTNKIEVNIESIDDILKL